MNTNEGEKTISFSVTDALISPLGLSVLTGAGLKTDADEKHVHVTYDVTLDDAGKATIPFEALADELGVGLDSTIKVCAEGSGATTAVFRPYATVLDGNGAIKDWAGKVEFDALTTMTDAHDIIQIAKTADATNKIEKELKVTVFKADNTTALANETVKLDFYCFFTTGATEITIEPNDFGGFFYVEADTLYRNQDGKDMAASLTFPKVKIQSAFTLSMSPNGDPSQRMGMAA